MPRPLAPSSRQLARRSSLCGLIAVSLALPACRGGAAGGSDDPALAAIQARMPPLPTVEVGPAPGFLAGGAADGAGFFFTATGRPTGVRVS